MKKILVVLLVLAVAGGVFAEGDWSVSGKGEIGFMLNFLTHGGISDQKDDVWIGASAYHMYSYYRDQTASLGVNYNRGGLTAGLGFSLWGSLGASMSYQDDDMAFQATADIQDLLDGTYGFEQRFWGWYKFMDGALHLEAAVDSRDTKFWTSSTAVGDLFDSDWNGLEAQPTRLGFGWGFADVDHHNYLVVDYTVMEGLQVGVLVPGVFARAQIPSWAGPGGHKWNWGFKTPGDNELGYHDFMGAEWAYSNHLRNVLVQTRIGLQYTGMEGLNIALQVVPDYSLNNTLGLYLGATYRVNSQIEAQANFEGYIGYGDKTKDIYKTYGTGKQNEDFLGAFALGARYSDGPLSAGLTFGMDIWSSDSTKNYYTTKTGNADWAPTIGIGIDASYNIIPTHLAFGLTSRVFINADRFSKYNDPVFRDDVGLQFSLIPQLHFNFMGTGAGIGYYWPNTTGILVRYYVTNNFLVNALDVTFNWSF